jgi:DNA-binding Xre family transcriptional regulator
MLLYYRGMIRLIVREVAERAGIKSGYELMQKTGLPPNTANSLWKGTVKRIDISTLDRLCIAFDVPPAQLFEFRREAPKRRASADAE